MGPNFSKATEWRRRSSFFRSGRSARTWWQPSIDEAPDAPNFTEHLGVLAVNGHKCTPVALPRRVINVHVPEQSHLLEPSGSASRRGRASAGGQRRLPAPTAGCGSLALSPDTMTASSQVFRAGRNQSASYVHGWPLSAEVVLAGTPSEQIGRSVARPTARVYSASRVRPAECVQHRVDCDACHC
jgi:hypothetical protein